MLSANIYLTFTGQCEEAFNFYRSIFGGEFDHISRFGEMPPQEGMPPMPEEMKNQIMHVSYRIGDSVVMGSDSSEAFGQATVIGNNFSISVNTDSKENADRFFNALSEGGKVTMPLNDTFWGAYFGMLTDRYGIQWMVNAETGQK